MPRLNRLLSLFLLLSTAVFFVSAQTSPAVRDPLAVAAVQNAIAALGSTANISQIADCTAQGNIGNPANPDSPGTFVWQIAGNEFNYTTHISGMDRTFLSGHGTPADLRNGDPAPTGPHVVRATLPFHIPGLVLLTELGNPNYSITYIGPETQNGLAVIHVQTADNSDSIGASVTPQDWYFDSSTFLPISLQYRVPDSVNATQYSTITKTFTSWTQVNGVTVPAAFINTMNPSASRTVTITSIVFNSGLSPSTFDPPTGGGQ